MADPFATVTDLEDALGRPVEPAQAALALAGASGAIRTYCGWHIAPSVTETLVVDGSGSRLQALPTMHLTDVTAVTNDGEDLVLTDIEWSQAGMLRWNHGPDWGWDRGRWWSIRFQGVTADVTHGYAEVPPEIVMICLNSAIGRLAAIERGSATRVQVGEVSVGYRTPSKDVPGDGELSPSDHLILERYAIPGSPGRA